MEQKCPECGSTDRKQEPGEFALLQLTQGRLKIDLETANSAVVVRVTTCGNCGLVSLQEPS